MELKAIKRGREQIDIRAERTPAEHLKVRVAMQAAYVGGMLRVGQLLEPRAFLLEAERIVRESQITEEIDPAEKTCPMCAEQVKWAAKICRFCQYQFEETSAAGGPH